MGRGPPGLTRTDTLCPYTPGCRSLCGPECLRDSPRAKVLLYGPEGGGCADFLGLRRFPRCTVAARVATILLQCKAGRDDSRRPPDPVRPSPSRVQAPSLSKGSPFSKMGKEERPFDKLGANGKGIDIHG